MSRAVELPSWKALVTFTALYLSTNYLYISSLVVISAALAQQLFTLSPVFVYLLGLIMFRGSESFDLLNLCFICGSVGLGAVIIYLSLDSAKDEVKESEVFLGVIEILSSALLAAVYKLQAFSWFSPHPTPYTMRTLQRVGIYGFVLSLGLSLILDFKFPGGAKLNWGYQVRVCE